MACGKEKKFKSGTAICSLTLVNFKVKPQEDKTETTGTRKGSSRVDVTLTEIKLSTSATNSTFRVRRLAKKFRSSGGGHKGTVLIVQKYQVTGNMVP